MPFNGTGTFVRVHNWTQDKDNNIPITASRFDGEDSDFATGLSTCITRDGQTTITDNIPFSNNKVTELGDGVLATDGVNVGQVQEGQFTDLGLLGGVADAYTAGPSPTITAYSASHRFTGKIPTTNLTTTPYLQISGIATPGTTGIIKKLNASGAEIAVEAGDLVGICDFKRNVANDAWIVLNPHKPYLNSANFVNTNFFPNLIFNGQGTVAQRGVTFDSTTTPANNDDTYLLDRMLLLSDGNDIVDVSQETTTVPTGAYSAIKFDQETANKQWGYVQILEARDAKDIIGGIASLSLKARKGGSNATLDTLRAAIISWSGTADTVTSDVVATWAGAGTNPSLAANWTYENTPSNLALTTSYQTFSIANNAIDTASTTNIAVFIWLDDTDATVGDLAYITDIKLENNTVVTDFVPRPYEQELSLCQRYSRSFSLATGNRLPGMGVSALTTLGRNNLQFSPIMRIAPAMSAVNTSDFRVFDGGTPQTPSSITTEDNSTYTALTNFTVASGLTIGRAAEVYSNAGTARLLFESEL